MLQSFFFPNFSLKGFIGFAPELHVLLTRTDVANDTEAGHQVLFTKAYLDARFREANKVMLDHESKIFENIQHLRGELFGSHIYQ